MYMQSSCSEMTPQGIAIKDAAVRFGNGKTLPFSPCKRGYIPVVGGKRMYACHLHNKERRKRFRREGRTFRLGEKCLRDFWDVLLHKRDDAEEEDRKEKKSPPNEGTSILRKGQLSKKESNGEEYLNTTTTIIHEDDDKNKEKADTNYDTSSAKKLKHFTVPRKKRSSQF